MMMMMMMPSMTMSSVLHLTHAVAPSPLPQCRHLDGRGLATDYDAVCEDQRDQFPRPEAFNACKHGAKHGDVLGCEIGCRNAKVGSWPLLAYSCCVKVCICLWAQSAHASCLRPDPALQCNKLNMDNPYIANTMNKVCDKWSTVLPRPEVEFTYVHNNSSTTYDCT